ncbi:MarR family transcriptional regulator [Microtetraspora sp. NBRC 13810]|uniref:MarR family winged helix-turn-helix transcriptional regulator n=1 Tax=Microtetraspora sp. NBRC 13810 TaxID=3030990 RepID=UPI0024A15319|nr:MarR family winged helix-turn-helix transcriptional regulator [Microtetraspora sp. NBRC 13810]GLW09768.1 MarR family transcriptional regulator [Microtetraspora sp. NBRC 13810]
MPSDDTCGELLVRLSDMQAVIKSFRQDVPVTGSRAGLMCLVALRRCGELRIGRLAELLEVDQSVASRHVADLEVHGMVVRIPNPSDGRSWYVRLTPDGDRAAGDALAHIRRRLAETLGEWTDEEITELSALLARLRVSFDAHRARVPHPSRTAQTVKGNR